jgi:hypothetical protein
MEAASALASPDDLTHLFMYFSMASLVHFSSQAMGRCRMREGSTTPCSGGQQETLVSAQATVRCHQGWHQACRCDPHVADSHAADQSEAPGPSTLEEQAHWRSKHGGSMPCQGSACVMLY